ncbi:MAG TPA: helix-turn-helix transcriptional regulator [Gemmatimonadaceae bacterium]|nr:helix-turn-helix transcriptional regulator [Gemmatimonadaceae bacterium]
MKSAREGLRIGGQKVTQGDLAKAVGVNRNTVSRWENGAMVPSDPATLASLAGALEVSVEWLISGEPAAGSAGSAGKAELHERSGRRYLDPATAELPERARSVALEYLDRLRKCGCTQEQRRGAESLLLAGARNTVSSTPFDERDDADVRADIDAAWDAVVQILRREGKRP